MGKDKRPSPEEMLVAAATDIHNDNCTLMARLADPDFDPATGLDCTLNGALEHIMALYERLLLFPQGFVPYEKVDFMVESTNALMSAVERRYRLASAHRAGQAFRESIGNRVPRENEPDEDVREMDLPGWREGDEVPFPRAELTEGFTERLPQLTSLTRSKLQALRSRRRR